MNRTETVATSIEASDWLDAPAFRVANLVSKPLRLDEHQQLADMLAVTLRLGLSSPAFEEQFRALHEAVDHHASSEETSMFVEAQRLGDDRLRVLGAKIEDMLDEERENRARRAFRSLKTRLLEGI